MVHICNGYFSAIKRDAFESVLTRYMNPESTIQSEVSQKRKINTVYEHIYMEDRKMLLIKLFARRQWRHRHREGTCGHSGKRRGREERKEEHGNLYVTICRVDSQWECAV